MYGKRIEMRSKRRKIYQSLACARADGEPTYQGSECAYNPAHGQERFVYFSTCVKCEADGFKGSAQKGITKTEAWYAKTTRQKYRDAKKGGYKLDKFLCRVEFDMFDEILGIAPRKRDDTPKPKPCITVKKKSDGHLTKRQLSTIRKQKVEERAMKKGGS